MWLTAIAKFVPVIISAVGAVERMSTKKGKDKQDEAVALVGDLLPAIEAGLGRDILNDDDVQDAVRKTIDAIVALNNVVRAAKAKSA